MSKEVKREMKDKIMCIFGRSVGEAFISKYKLDSMTGAGTIMMCEDKDDSKLTIVVNVFQFITADKMNITYIDDKGYERNKLLILNNRYSSKQAISIIKSSVVKNIKLYRGNGPEPTLITEVVADIKDYCCAEIIDNMEEFEFNSSLILSKLFDISVVSDMMEQYTMTHADVYDGHMIEMTDKLTGKEMILFYKYEDVTLSENVTIKLVAKSKEGSNIFIKKTIGLDESQKYSDQINLAVMQMTGGLNNPTITANRLEFGRIYNNTFYETGVFQSINYSENFSETMLSSVSA